MYFIFGKPYYVEEWEEEAAERDSRSRKVLSEWIVENYEKKKRERAEKRNRKRI